MSTSYYRPNPAMIPELQHDPYMHAEMEARGEEIAKVAADLAPVLTGALSASISAEVQSDAEVIVSSDVRYAAYVEFGTSDTPTQPFLRPAGDQVIG